MKYIYKPPAPPGNITTNKPIFVQSYINAYNTAFNQPPNLQRALRKYRPFIHSEIDSNFVPGSFGYHEGYTGSISNSQSKIVIDKLKNDLEYILEPLIYLFRWALEADLVLCIYWIIITYGVPYVVSVS